MDDPLSQIQFIAPGIDAIICLISAIFLLLVSGFASGAEIAFFSLSPNDLSELNPDNTKDKKILMLRDDSERTLATILITNNFVNVTIIMLLNYFFSQVVDFGTAYWVKFLFLTVLLTFLLLLFGEIIPKVYSRVSPLAFCRNVVNGILFFRQLFWPIGTLLLGSGILAERFVQRTNYDITADELEQALDMTDKEEIRDEKEMLEGIIRFSDEMVREIMTSRQDIADIDIKSSFKDVIDNIVENNYSRIPVYQGSIDNIRGILYIKDLLPHIGKGDSFRWQTLIRPAYFVPETKKIDDLLREFQTNKVHIAIVVDEFGGIGRIAVEVEEARQLLADASHVVAQGSFVQQITLLALAAGVANHARGTAQEGDGLMAATLQMAQHHDATEVTDMETVGRRVDAHVGRHLFFLKEFFGAWHHLVYHATPCEFLYEIHLYNLQLDNLQFDALRFAGAKLQRNVVNPWPFRKNFVTLSQNY